MAPGSPRDIGQGISRTVCSAVGDKEVQSSASRISVVRGADEPVERVGSLLAVSAVHLSPAVDEAEPEAVVEKWPELSDSADDAASESTQRLSNSIAPDTGDAISEPDPASALFVGR